MQLLKLTILVLFTVLTSVLIAQEQQEVVIIGTMHQVPGIVSKAYRPMLKNAIKYQPQAIYVERQPAWDSVSVKNYFPKFYANADSLRKAMPFNTTEINGLMEKRTADLHKDEADQLRLYYYSRFDYANMEFYKRLKKYGVEGATKPSKNENGDLTYPLAIAMGIKDIKSMDNQTYYEEYSTTWRACSEVSRVDGEIKILKKALKKLNWNSYTGVLNMINLGAVTNYPKNLALMHKLNSMEYRETKCEPCDEANYYWDYRNEHMVKNTATQMITSGDIRSVIIVGAGHVYGMMEAFARDYPQIKVIRYNDMGDNRGKVSDNDRVSETFLVSHR